MFDDEWKQFKLVGKGSKIGNMRNIGACCVMDKGLDGWIDGRMEGMNALIDMLRVLERSKHTVNAQINGERERREKARCMDR